MVMLVGCTAKKAYAPSCPDIYALITEKDLVPEGTAYDQETGQVFISSMYKRKVIAVRKDGSYYDFILEGQDGIWATLGMAVEPKTRRLYVLSSKGDQGIVTRLKIDDGSWASRLYCYDISSRALIKIYDVKQKWKGTFCFNDLTLSDRGEVFITESISNRIFILPAGEDSLDVFLAPKGYHFLNGLAFNTIGSKLYVSSSEGLMVVDMKSRDYGSINYPSAVDPAPVDGLTFYRQSLIGHQSKILTRFFLTDDGIRITNNQVIDSTGLDGSTTGELGLDGWYYYIGNSQIRSGIDYSSRQIMPYDSLEPIQIKRVRLEGAR